MATIDATGMMPGVKRSTRALASLALCLSIAFALSLALVGCTGNTIPSGAVLPLSGGEETYGTAIRRGIELALARIEADPTYPIELEFTFLDSESNPERAKELLEQLYRDGAFAVIGGATSAEAKAMVSVADRFDRVLLSPSASAPELTGVSRNFYRIFPSDFTSATKMASAAMQNLGLENVVIIAEEETYAKGIQEVFRSEFERFGGEVLEVIEYPPHTSDFSGLVERAVTLQPQAVYLAAYESATGAMIQALRQKDYTGKILTTSAFALPSAIARVGEDAVGVILTQTVFELDSEFAHVKAFVNAYREKYNEPPDLFSAHGYDAMMLLAEAFRDKPPLPSEVPKGLRTIKDFPGVTGSIQFDEKGDVQKFPRLYVIGDDLALYDYNARVQQQKEELQRRLDELREKAQALGSDS